MLISAARRRSRAHLAGSPQMSSDILRRVFGTFSSGPAQTRVCLRAPRTGTPALRPFVSLAPQVETSIPSTVLYFLCERWDGWGGGGRRALKAGSKPSSCSRMRFAAGAGRRTTGSPGARRRARKVSRNITSTKVGRPEGKVSQQNFGGSRAEADGDLNIPSVCVPWRL